MSSDFYATSIVPFAPIIIKICRAYTNTQEDFEDHYQEVCLQIWRSHRTSMNVRPGPRWWRRKSMTSTRGSRGTSSTGQRMQRINEIAIVIGAPILWVFLSATGIPYTGAIICAVWVGLLVVRRLYIAKFNAPDSSLDSYHYLKAFHGWLKDRMARSRRVQRHLYAVTFLALAIGVGASEPGQLLIRLIVESNPDIRLVNGVPVVLIAGVGATAIVVDLLGGVIFDFDVNTVYRGVFRKLDEMVAEMEELRG